MMMNKNKNKQSERLHNKMNLLSCDWLIKASLIKGGSSSKMDNQIDNSK